MKNTFQKTLVAFAFLLVANFVMAQAPQGIPYQAVARDNAGNLIKNQNIALRFKIHDGTANGAVVYSETHSVTTDALGLFSVNIGGGTSTSTLADVNWGSGAKFTQVALDVTGGSNFIDMGTTQMMSVPYALYAGSSATSTTTIGPIGAIAAVNGATISSGVLSLAPADETNGGVVTTGTQTLGGVKKFTSNIQVKDIQVGTVKGTYNADDSFYPFTNLVMGDGLQNGNYDLLYNSSIDMDYSIPFDNNTAIGIGSLKSITSGNENTAVGFNTLNSSLRSENQTAIGSNALKNSSGSANTAIGTNALTSNTRGSQNVGIGAFALSLNTTGYYNTSIGRSSMYANTTGIGNTASGHYALLNNTTGQYNSSYGKTSLFYNATGNNNVGLGYNAGTANTTGSFNSFVGAGSNSFGSLENATAIGGLAYVGASNSMVLGSIDGVNGATSNTNVGIGTTTPTERLDVVGNVKVSGNTTINGATTANSFVKTGGTSSQYLMADGSTSAGTVATTMGAIGASSTDNGATITSGVLSLTPADATNGGIVTNGTQTFAGNKTFTGTSTANSFVKIGGTSSQYLMADGSTSAGTVVTTGSQTFAGNKTFTGTTTANGFVKAGGTSTQYLMADGSTSAGTEATTMGAIGASSAANGATITSGVLSLAPADATNGGIVTNGTQTFAGDKTFSSAITITAGSPGAGKVLTSDNTGLASWETPAANVNTVEMRYLIVVTGDYPSTSGGTGRIIGQIIPFAGNSIPNGCFECKGQILNINSYATLFSIIGSRYGGDGKTTFALPNLTGKSIIGR